MVVAWMNHSPDRASDFYFCGEVKAASFVSLMSPNGTKRKCRHARAFPKLGADRLCHPPAGHSRP
jgi:hypothetical protein